MSDTMRDIFVNNLRYLMDSRDINQADICRELGVSSATVSDWCTGKKYPRVDAMQRLADLLGVRFSMLTAENGIKNYKDQQLLEALHQDPKLRMLFDRVLTMSKEDREKMFQISGIIKGELYGDD